MYRQKSSTPVVGRKESGEKSKKTTSTSSQDGLTEAEWDEGRDLKDVPEYLTSPHSEKLSYINESFICDLQDPRAIEPRNGSWDGDVVDPEKGSVEKKEEEAEGRFPYLKGILKKHKRKLKVLFKVSLFILYNVYFGFAIYKTWHASETYCDGVKFLTIITAISYIFAFYSYIFRPHLLKCIKPCLMPFIEFVQKLASYRHSSKVVWFLILTAIGIFLVIDTADDRYRLVSTAGLFLLILFGFIFSKHRSKIVWRHLLWGLTIQFCIGLFILRWSVGKEVFRCLGDKVKAFLDETDKGSTFVFGYLVSGEMVDAEKQLPVFAFKVLSVIIFFSFIVSLLYYYGVMQILVLKVGWLLQVTIGTTACESMNAAANIFLGMTEAPLLIRPFLPLMTKSELHAVMTGGFATIAGSVLAAYINFGINASHLLTASVMAAPAALAYSKLMYPETEESRTQAENIKMERGSETNALEAATNGASAAIQLVSNIAANLLAFVAFIALVDSVFGWLGSLVLWNDLSFEWLLSKIFIPIALLMGVDFADGEQVANLIGLKTTVNEFVAYKRLAEYQDKKMISERSAAIATFALCGFSNISSIGIQLGALSALAPERKPDLSQIAVRAMIAGTVTCFINACVAGTLIRH